MLATLWAPGGTSRTSCTCPGALTGPAQVIPNAPRSPQCPAHPATPAGEARAPRSAGKRPHGVSQSPPHSVAPWGGSREPRGDTFRQRHLCPRSAPLPGRHCHRLIPTGGEGGRQPTETSPGRRPSCAPVHANTCPGLAPGAGRPLGCSLSPKRQPHGDSQSDLVRLQTVTLGRSNFYPHFRGVNWRIQGFGELPRMTAGDTHGPGPPDAPPGAAAPPLRPLKGR